jgi:Fe-S-cluster containining protein
MRKEPKATMSDESTVSQPWYRDGLRFECTQCGNCCTGSPGYVWVNDEEIRAIAAYLDKPLGEIRLLNTRPARGKVSLIEYPNGDCIYFDPRGRGCTIYPVRPVQCRTWPFWSSNLESPEAWRQLRSVCPGAGQGDLIPLETICQRAQQES